LNDKRISYRRCSSSAEAEVPSERSITSAAALRQVLDETFNVTPPAPLEEIFSKIDG